MNVGTGDIFTVKSGSETYLSISSSGNGIINKQWLITNGGKLTIGSASPGLQPFLEIKNTGAPGGNWSLNVSESGDFAIRDNNTPAINAIYIKSGSGNVGIRTNTPAYALTVSGTVAFSNLVTSSTTVSNVVMWGANGELFTTASSAIGGGGSTPTLKAGSGSVVSFAGIPLSSSITFGTAFANNSYAVTVTGEDARSWTIQSKSNTGFTINSNSTVALTGPVYWIATPFN